MARISSELAAAAVGGRYDLVLIASRRVRELSAGWAPMVEVGTNDRIVTALREIEEGHVGRDYLLKAPVVESQRRNRRKEQSE